MIKVDISKTHNFSTIFYFSGAICSDSGRFLFRESESIFGSQNMGSILIEYQTKDELADFLLSSKGENLLAECKIRTPGKVALVDVQVSDVDIFKVEFEKNQNLGGLISIIEYVFREDIKLPLEMHDTLENREQFADVVNLKISFPAHIIEKQGHLLSSIHHHAIDSSFYVDSQVPIFYLAPAISGVLRSVCGSY